MRTISRRSLIASLMVSAAGCATQPPTPILPKPDDQACAEVDSYPTAKQISEQEAPQGGHVKEISLFFKNRDNLPRDVAASSLDDTQKAALIRKRLKEEFWVADVKVTPIIGGYGHLSVHFRPVFSPFQFFFVQAESSAPARRAEPESQYNQGDLYHARNYDKNEQLFGGPILFATTDLFHNLRTVHSIRLDYREMLEAVVKTCALIMDIDVRRYPYKTFGDNSNSFAFSVLKHALGDKFTSADEAQVIKASGLKLPGYGRLILPDFQVDPALRIGPQEGATEILLRIGEKGPTFDCVTDMRNLLVRRWLAPFARYVEATPIPELQPIRFPRFREDQGITGVTPVPG